MDVQPFSREREIAGVTTTLLGDWRERNPHRGDLLFDPELWLMLARAGLLDGTLPNVAAGPAFGLLDQCTVLTALGRFGAPVPYASSIAVATGLVTEFGTLDQVERWVLPVWQADATFGVVDGRGIAARGGRLYGSHAGVAAGAFADFLIVLSPDGVYLTSRSEYAVVMARPRLTGLTGAAAVEFDGAQAERLAGPDGVRRVGVRTVLSWCAWQLGVVEEALSSPSVLPPAPAMASTEYHSAVAEGVARGHTDVATLRSALRRAAACAPDDVGAEKQIMTARHWATRAVRTAQAAARLHRDIGVAAGHSPAGHPSGMEAVFPPFSQ